MPDNPIDTQAERTTAGKPESAGPANTPQDAATGAVKPQDGPMDRPGTGAEDAADRSVSGEPVGLSEDDPGVGMTEAAEPDIEGSRGM